MAQWGDHIYAYLLNLPPGGSQTLGTLGTLFPRPLNVPRTRPLSNILSNDGRFTIIGDRVSLRVVANGTNHQRAPPESRSRNQQIIHFSDDFFDFVTRLPNDQLIVNEIESVLNVTFERWQTQNQGRGSLPTLLNSLIQRNRIIRFREHYIFSVDEAWRRIRMTAIMRDIQQREVTMEIIERNREGIEISQIHFHLNEDGSQHSIRRGGNISREVIIKNRSEHTYQLTLIEGKHHPIFTHSFLLPMDVPPTSEVRGFIRCTPTAIGYIRDILVFSFAGFPIGRAVEVECCADPDLVALLRPVSAFQQNHRNIKSMIDGEIEEGVKLEAPQTQTTNYRSPDRYQVPNEWKERIALGEARDVLMQLSNNVRRNYVELFRKLLWSEEFKLEKDILVYSMFGIQLRSERFKLALQVPGLAENRPSVLRGDSVVVKRSGQIDGSSNRIYRGYAHEVRRDDVLLRFCDVFHRAFQPSQQYDVQFEVNRSTLRQCHHSLVGAVKHLSQPYSYLLPTSLNVMEPLVMFNRGLGVGGNLNEEQAEAVAHIVEGKCRTVPYVVFGPPGTGALSSASSATPYHIEQIRRSAINVQSFR